ncbi:nucleoside diphosphate kinase regulator, partial [Cronobacter sakazakii]
DALNDELDRARMVSPQAMPEDVVTMNSRVKFRDLASGETYERLLVYPQNAGSSPEALSVMAPVGAALLGLRVGDAIRWPLPDGSETHIEVLELLYQPEAAGEYRL